LTPATGSPLAVEQSAPRARHFSVLALNSWDRSTAQERNETTQDPRSSSVPRHRAHRRCRMRSGASGLFDETPSARDSVTSVPPTDVAKRRVRALLTMTFTTRPGARASDLALAGVRIALAWIFIYYGAGKLFGAFNGPGLHNTALFFSNTAHLHPGDSSPSRRRHRIWWSDRHGPGPRFASGRTALFGDQVMAMITVTWVNGINSESLTPVMSSTSPRRHGPRHCLSRSGTSQHRRLDRAPSRTFGLIGP